MKKIRRIFMCLVLLVIFGGNILTVNALSANDLEKINEKFGEYNYLIGSELFDEGSHPNNIAIRYYSCWTFDNVWESKYVIGYDDPQSGNGPKFKVPADVFEKYVTDTFNVSDTTINFLRENFNSIDMIKDARYVTEADGNYYMYTLITGWGTVGDTFAQLKGVKDLGNNTYQAYYYYLVNEEDLQYIDMDDSLKNELKINENSVLGRDYIVQDNYNGEETRYIIVQFYSSKIIYNNGNIKFLSNKLIEKSAVPNDSELSLFVAPKVEKKELKFLNGEKQDFNIEGNDLLTFRIDADVNLLEDVYIDAEIVDPKNYTVKSGSTIITFNKEYTKKLKTGEHTLLASYSDGTYAETTFNLNIGNPATFANGFELIILVGFFVSLMIIIGRVTKKGFLKEN